MGGLMFSAVVSLIIVPLFYVWFDDLNLWRMRVFGSRPSNVPGGVPEQAVPAQLGIRPDF
jgi:hypothetical protein